MRRTLWTLLVVLFSPLLPAAEVYFDQAHGQRFVIERDGELELSQFAQLWREQQFRVSSSATEITAAELRAVNAVVISGAFTPYSATELTALYDFVDGGGVLIVTLHVGPLNGLLLNRFGVGVSNGVVIEQNRRLNSSGSDFVAIAKGAHPLTRELDTVAIYGGWALNPSREATILFATSEAAWMDLNRNRRFDAGEPQWAYAMGLVRPVGAGYVVVFGDDAIFQNRFLQQQNKQLAENLVAWVKELSVRTAATADKGE